MTALCCQNRTFDNIPKVFQGRHISRLAYCYQWLEGVSWAFGFSVQILEKCMILFGSHINNVVGKFRFPIAVLVTLFFTGCGGGGSSSSGAGAPTSTGPTLSMFVGSLNAVGSANGSGTAASFNLPRGIAIGGAGNIYVADFANNTIRKISSTGDVTTLAGTPGVAGRYT